MDNDLGLLILRLALGPMLVVHGWNKVSGPGGLAGTTRWFDGLGLRPAGLHARVAAVSEIGAGLFLTLGLLTGLTALAFVGLMIVAMRTDHRGKGYFVFKGGWEYTLLVAMVAVGLAATGPGEYSLDAALGLDFAGVVWAGIAAVGGVLAAAALLALSYRPAAAGR
ncbi:DoxX family protein [Streptomyces gardneri]|nr:DoxX family protein [Streptomyces gardneri]